MKIAITEVDNTQRKQALKIHEEALEVIEAICNQESRDRIVSEILDTIQASITLLQKYGVCEKDLEVHYNKMLSYEKERKLKIVKTIKIGGNNNE